MDLRTPALALLGALLAGFALAVLGLAADNVAYVHQHRDSTLDTHYIRWNSTAQAPYSYWVTLEYLPSRFTMTQMNAMVATGVICALVGVAVAVSSCVKRGSKTAPVDSSSPKNQKIQWTTIASLAATTTAFVFSLAIAIYVWKPVMRWPIVFRNSLPLPPTGSKGVVQYQSPFAFTPDVWNCLLAPYAVQTADSKRLRGLCRESNVARYLTIVLPILSAALLVCLAWTWLQASKAAVPKPAPEVKEIDDDFEDISIHEGVGKATQG